MITLDRDRTGKASMRRFVQVSGMAMAGLSALTLTACSGSSTAGTQPAVIAGPSTGSTAASAAASASASATISAPTTSAVQSPGSTTAAAKPVPALGAGASLHGRRPFPASNPWNTPVDKAAVDPRSSTLIASIGLSGHLHPDFGADYDGGPFGIPYIVVSGTQKRVPVSFDYADESDKGPYPIPAKAPIEGGANSDGDRHVLVVDRDHWKLYELYDAHPKGGGWTAGSGAVFNLTTGKLRPAGWTSADAAGLPIFPGLVRYDEVSAGVIKHALRFTVSRTRNAYVAPARHSASDSASSALPPMGMRVRLKASFKISGYPKQARVVLQAMKTYGMIVADNGSNWYVSGAPDKRWDDDALNTLKQVPGSAFEALTPH
jgi:hypothetical protein